MRRQAAATQEQVFDFIQAAIITAGQAPTYDEMVRSLGCSRAYLSGCITRLVDAQRLVKTPYVPRGISLP